MDMLPTFASYAGAKVPVDREVDGQSLAPVLEGKSEGWERTLYYWSDTELRAVRKGPWKLHVRTNNQVDQPTGARDADPPLLYHLDNDPSEQYDLAAARPEVVRELRALLDSHKQTTRFGELQR
jgi:arylsulfatase A-like enzyme